MEFQAVGKIDRRGEKKRDSIISCIMHHVDKSNVSFLIEVDSFLSNTLYASFLFAKAANGKEVKLSN